MAAENRHQNIARRYAIAFFSLAQDQSQISQISDDLQSIKVLLTEGATEISEFLNNTTLTRDAQEKTIHALAQYMKVSPLTGKFLGTLARKRRLAVLPAIIDAAEGLIAAYKGEATAQVTSAEKLTEAQVKNVTEHLKKMTGLAVRLDLGVDPEIMGGLIVRIGSQLIDSSVKTKLERLQRSLKNANSSSDSAKMREVA